MLFQKNDNGLVGLVASLGLLNELFIWVICWHHILEIQMKHRATWQRGHWLDRHKVHCNQRRKHLFNRRHLYFPPATPIQMCGPLLQEANAASWKMKQHKEFQNRSFHIHSYSFSNCSTPICAIFSSFHSSFQNGCIDQ